MNAHQSRHYASAARRVGCTAALLVAAATASAADVGLKVGLQVWNPAQPEQEHVAVAYDSSNALSAAVSRAWDARSDTVREVMISELSKANRFKAGMTLYQVTPTLARPDFRMEYVAGSTTAIWVIARFRGNQIRAKVTTPDAQIPIVGRVGVDRAADPDVTVKFDFDVRVAVMVLDDPVNTLSLNTAEASISGVQLVPNNTSARVLQGLNQMVAWLGGADMQQKIVRSIKAAAPGGHREDLYAIVAGELKTINAAIRPAANHVRAGAWLHQGQLVLAFSPRPMPLPPSSGTIEGAIRWPEGYRAAQGCASFSMRAVVQAAPSPILGPNFALGASPMRDVGQFVATGEPRVHLVTAGGSSALRRYECQYRLTQLPVGYAAKIIPALPRLVSDERSTGPQSVRNTIVPTLRPEGWNGEFTVPAPLAQGRDFSTETLAIKPHLPQDVRRMTTADLPTPPVAIAPPNSSVPTLLVPRSQTTMPARPAVMPQGMANAVRPNLPQPALTTEYAPAVRAATLVQAPPASPTGAPLRLVRMGR